MRRLRSTPTKAPNPPHTTRPNPWGRGRDMSASAPCSLNALDTQPWSAYQGAGGDGGSRCIAQAWQGNTPRTPTLWPVECEAWEAINRRRVGTPVRPGGEIRSIGGAPAGARSFASDRGWRRLDWKRMGGHMRGRMTRACGKADERTIDESIDGGCTLSHETVVMKSNQLSNRTPDSSGGIKSIVDRSPNQCDCRPGGVLRSVCWIGTNGVAGTSGEAGTPNFKSVSRPLAGAGMLPQGRLAGEHGALHEPVRHVVEWVGSHLFLCYRIRLCVDRNYFGSSSIHKIQLVSAW